MARGVAHAPETRAAVLAALLAGQSVSAVARRWKLGHATVVAWRDAAGVGSTVVQPQKREEIGERVSAVLAAFLTTIQVQADLARDPEWVKRQSAESLAVFIGVLSDKAIRILEAIEPADSAGSGPADAESP